jgi:hypothetical protein
MSCEGLDRGPAKRDPGPARVLRKHKGRRLGTLKSEDRSGCCSE